MKIWISPCLRWLVILASSHVNAAEERPLSDTDHAQPISVVETGVVKGEIVRYVSDDTLPLWTQQVSNRESNQSQRSYFGSLLLANVLATHPCAAKEGELSIDQTLAQAQFNTVQMPPEQALISKYGTGDTFVRQGESYHVYYLPNLRLWLQCKGDIDDKLYKPISEIMISRIDLATRVQPAATLDDLNLKGIRIGDNIQKALSQWGEPLRKYPKSLGKKRTTVFEFFPDSLVEGSCLRFFVRDEMIVAFSYSSEE
jgi:hypothetical protein